MWVHSYSPNLASKEQPFPVWFLLEAVPSLNILFEFPVIQVPKTFSQPQECESSELSDFSCS